MIYWPTANRQTAIWWTVIAAFMLLGMKVYLIDIEFSLLSDCLGGINRSYFHWLIKSYVSTFRIDIFSNDIFGQQPFVFCHLVDCNCSIDFPRNQGCPIRHQISADQWLMQWHQQVLFPLVNQVIFIYFQDWLFHYWYFWSTGIRQTAVGCTVNALQIFIKIIAVLIGIKFLFVQWLPWWQHQVLFPLANHDILNYFQDWHFH